jgi:methylmalonyl-CoA mutase cobalamin-binding subunit
MSKKTYTVMAETGFDGHAKGEQFEADLDRELEERAIERGSIKSGKHTIKEEEEGG